MTRGKLIVSGIGCLVALSGLWWILGIWEDSLLAEAKASEAMADAALAAQKQSEESARLAREAHELERREWAEQQASLARSVAARNQATERLIQAALAPKALPAVKQDAEDAGLKPTVRDDGFHLTVQEMQEYVALKLDRDRLADNLKETERQLDLERETTRTLRLDLGKAIASLEQSAKTIQDYQDAMDAYKRVARKSKWRRAVEFGGRAALTFGVAYLGAKAGSR